MNLVINCLANSQASFLQLLKASIFLVMMWLGGLKIFQYEAEGFVPFVANSPLMNFFYNTDAPEYQHYKTKEANTSRKTSNGTKQTTLMYFPTD
jgi:uncharacterized membrane protein YkgB